MKGSKVKRGALGRNRYPWGLIIDRGRVLDRQTGALKRKQQWISFEGTERQAEEKLADLVHAAKRDELPDATKLTVGAWLTKWIDERVKPNRRPSTHRVYLSILNNHIATAPLGQVAVQRVRSTHIEACLAALTDAKPATVQVHFAILRKALGRAVKDRLLTRNPATDVDRPSTTASQEAKTLARVECWSAEQVRRFLQAARKAGAQVAAFFSLALDTGARRNELLALRWSDVDFDKATVTIARQLDGISKPPECAPIFGVTKTKTTRCVEINAETVERLRVHKREQATLIMKNRTSYDDSIDLVFAKQHPDLTTQHARLGQPVPALADRYFAATMKAANVPTLRFHALRHTSISLLLANGVPPHVVAKRVGHAKPSMTLDVYAHVLDGQQERAATTIGGLIYG